jgi:hypothetical protein
MIRVEPTPRWNRVRRVEAERLRGQRPIRRRGRVSGAGSKGPCLQLELVDQAIEVGRAGWATFREGLIHRVCSAYRTVRVRSGSC